MSRYRSDPRTEALTPADAKRACFDKRSYDSKTSARDKAAVIKKQDGRQLTPYRCMVCRRWHLTHHDPAELPDVKRALRNRAGTTLAVVPAAAPFQAAQPRKESKS
jgi:hypothetical protein